MSCKGSDSTGEPWTLNVRSGENNSYGGVLKSKGSSLVVRSLHGRALGGQGPLLGFALGESGGTIIAVQKLYNGNPGGLWLSKKADVAPTSVGAMLALLLFSPGR